MCQYEPVDINKFSTIILVDINKFGTNILVDVYFQCGSDSWYCN